MTKQVEMSIVWLHRYGRLYECAHKTVYIHASENIKQS